MSADLQWLIVRSNSCFLVKRPGLTLTKEPGNLKNRNSFRFSGLVQRKVVGIEAAADNNGITLTTKNVKGHRRPSKNTTSVVLKRGSRRTLSTLKKVLKNNKYRTDLKNAALRRASAILRSQKAYVPKKVSTKKKE